LSPQSRLFAFCRLHGGSRAMSRALARALALHPTEASLWSYAASWEWRQRKDAPAARALMQRALRACPASAGLWADYFGLEVAYAATLRERRSVLGLALPPADAAADASTDAADAGVSADVAAVDAASPALAPGLAALLRGAVASAVFRAASAALPSGEPALSLAEQCLEALKPHAAWAAHLASEVTASLATPAAAAQPAAWALRASLAPSPAAAAALYEQGLVAAPCADMWGRYANALAAAGDVPALHALARRALGARQASEALLLLWVESLLSSGRDADAAQAAEDATRAVPGSARLWALRLRLAAASAGGGDDNRRAKTHMRMHVQNCDALLSDAFCACIGTTHSGAGVMSLALAALRSVPAADAAPLWRLALQVCAATGAPADDLHSLLRRACAGGGGGGALASAAAAAVRAAALRGDGLASARALSAPLLRLPGPGEPLYAATLGLEAAEARRVALHATPHDAPTAAPAALAAARRVAEAALAAHGAEHPRLWVSLLQLESDAGDGAAAAGRLYWRARKALRDPAPLAAAYGSLAV
jgi:U3 small nucleolar RNA-associated protein 6